MSTHSDPLYTDKFSMYASAHEILEPNAYVSSHSLNMYSQLSTETRGLILDLSLNLFSGL